MHGWQHCLLSAQRDSSVLMWWHGSSGVKDQGCCNDSLHVEYSNESYFTFKHGETWTTGSFWLTKVILQLLTDKRTVNKRPVYISEHNTWKAITFWATASSSGIICIPLYAGERSSRITLKGISVAFFIMNQFMGDLSTLQWLCHIWFLRFWQQRPKCFKCISVVHCCFLEMTCALDGEFLMEALLRAVHLDFK